MSLRTASKVAPYSFEGEADHLQAKKWLLQIEKMLDVMNCSEDQSVSFASFMLQREVKH